MMMNWPVGAEKLVNTEEALSPSSLVGKGQVPLPLGHPPHPLT